MRGQFIGVKKTSITTAKSREKKLGKTDGNPLENFAFRDTPGHQNVGLCFGKHPSDDKAFGHSFFFGPGIVHSAVKFSIGCVRAWNGTEQFGRSQFTAG